MEDMQLSILLKGEEKNMFQFEEIKEFGKPYIIAEIGANHNGDMELAKK